MKTNVTLRHALEVYRTRVSILKKGYAQEKYRISKLSASSLAERQISSITSVDIATYRDSRLLAVNPKTQNLLSPSTVRLELSLLSNLFDLARMEWGFCESNPVKSIRKPKPAPSRDRRLTPREDRLISKHCLAHPNRELHSIVVIALETAMRQGEILNLRWEHINLKERVAHLPVTKNGKRRDVPLSLTARDALTRLGVEQNGPVFSYKSTGIKSTWRAMTDRLNIEDLHFHDLRHESVSRLFELGSLDMMEIASISGHQSLSMLKRYTHLKARRLVKKLEGQRNKGRAAVLSTLIPYPAEIKPIDDLVQVKFLDFENLIYKGSTKEAAILGAQNVLMRRIMTTVRAGRSLPMPDQYLESIPISNIVMIDPLDENACELP